MKTGAQIYKNINVARQKLAFTLAEVLITLGIIGIVAAMTIPTLLTQYQKEQTATQLKRTYSLISQLYSFAELENGFGTSWSHPTADFEADASIAWWNKYIIPTLESKMSIAKKCTDLDTTQCWPNGWYLNGVASSNTTLPTYALNDGTTILLSGVGNEHGLIFVDINGIKAPNIMGKDRFAISVGYTKSKVQMWGATENRTVLLGGNDRSCDKGTGTQKGGFCGALIQRDNWEIKEDYPW